MRSTECLYYHRCVFAGVIIAASCSLKLFLKNNPKKDLLNLEIWAGNTSECNLEKWKLINLSYTLTSLKRNLFFFSFNTIFSGCILIPDAFQGIWDFFVRVEPFRVLICGTIIKLDILTYHGKLESCLETPTIQVK